MHTNSAFIILVKLIRETSFWMSALVCTVSSFSAVINYKSKHKWCVGFQKVCLWKEKFIQNAISLSQSRTYLLNLPKAISTNALMA